MVFDRIEGFVEAARIGSVSRAAQALYISQPALTARIKSLETELGTQLLVRTARGVRLTDAGEVFLPYAQQALDTLAAGRQHVARLHDGTTEHLTLATPPALSTYVLPPMLWRFRRRWPSVRITLRTCDPADVIRLVLNGDAQLGLGCDTTHPQLASVPLYRDELVLVLAPDHPAAQRSVLQLHDLATEPIIMLPNFEDEIGRILARAGVEPDAITELDSIDAAKSMVVHMLGLALLPLTAVDAELQAGRLVRRDIETVDSISRHVVALRRDDTGEPTGPCAWFLDPTIVYGDERKPAAGDEVPLFTSENSEQHALD
ncbi:hypothetical protein DSM104299_02058 [Baekduia alba]|uniref:LysR family transcriptional regulator n=1 Tax=Baekduia alba TaxID=2997333 RepID=UPI002341DF56|nr:LysR family transcriptional regulator [Baekduia alba]WCB93345.1 hypothetical protein DSM104299_02058 [Baekduia alba]